MIDTIKLKWKLFLLFRERDKNYKLYSLAMGRARAEGEFDEVNDLIGEAGQEDRMLQDSIDSIVTRYWLRKATRKFVPVPERSAVRMWKRSEFDDRWLLTEEGVSAVRNSVHEENKRAFEFWVVLGSGITGAIGAATGLIAVLKN